MTQSNQSIATRKYEASHGWVSKSYKLKKDIVDEFKAVCDQRGESQAGILMKLMKEYIDTNK